MSCSQALNVLDVLDKHRQSSERPELFSTLAAQVDLRGSTQCPFFIQKYHSAELRVRCTDSCN